MVDAVRETGAGGETAAVFDEQAVLLWSVISTQSNVVGGQIVVTFDIQVEGEEDGLVLTMSLLEMGGAMSATSTWSDATILTQRSVYSIEGVSSLGDLDFQGTPILVSAELALVPTAQLTCKCDAAGGGGCSKDDCESIRACPTPPPGGGINSCALMTSAF